MNFFKLHSRTYSYCQFLALLCLVLVASQGCKKKPIGPPRHETLGVVTYEGQPVVGAQVVFYSQKLRISRGAMTNAQGEFRVRAASGHGLPAGEYIVVVRPAPPELSSPSEKHSRDMDHSLIPRRFHKKDTSDLTRTVSEGENRIDLELFSGDSKS